MKLFDILKQCGVFSSDIKNRIKNKQIIINGEPVDSNIELEIETDIIVDNNLGEIVKAKIFETGGFICNILSKENTNIFSKQMRIFGFENLFRCLVKLLLMFELNRLSKPNVFICSEKI